MLSLINMDQLTGLGLSHCLIIFRKKSPNTFLFCWFKPTTKFTNEWFLISQRLNLGTNRCSWKASLPHTSFKLLLENAGIKFHLHFSNYFKYNCLQIFFCCKSLSLRRIKQVFDWDGNFKEHFGSCLKILKSWIQTNEFFFCSLKEIKPHHIYFF